MSYGNIMLDFNFSIKKKKTKKIFWEFIENSAIPTLEIYSMETNKCIKMHVKNTYCEVVQNNKTIKTS